MKKKIKALISVIIICSLLVACSQKAEKPDTVSEEMYTIGTKAVKITDKYLNADLTLDEAFEEISNLYDQAHSAENDEYDYDLSVAVDIGSIHVKMMEMNIPMHSEYTDSDIKDARDELAETLNLQ